MISLFKVYMSEENSFENVIDVVKSGFVGQGSKVDEFESKLKTLYQNDNLLYINLFKINQTNFILFILSFTKNINNKKIILE